MYLPIQNQPIEVGTVVRTKVNILQVNWQLYSFVCLVRRVADIDFKAMDESYKFESTTAYIILNIIIEVISCFVLC